MSTVCYSSIKGLAMRATRLDSVGRWVTGTTSTAVSSGFVNINLTAQVEDGQEFVVKNANGDLCINEKDSPRVKYLDVEIEFCQVDPELFELLTGVRLLADYAGANVGYTINETFRTASGVALEAWTKIPGATGNLQYVYWLMPMLVNGIVSDYTIEDGPMTFKMKANTNDNANWGKGPYDVVAQNVGLTPGKLLANVLSKEHLYTRQTEIAPPTAQCGYVTLSTPYVSPS